MSGHSHWATIRRKKDAADAKKGRVFSKLARSIMAAARMGGADPTTNVRLKQLLDDARAARMPKENIERAVRKGTGDLDGEQLEEIVYEAYGPGGVAIMIEILTDNRNRTASEVRKLLELSGGSLAGSGATAWIFEQMGLVTVLCENADEETLFEVAVEAGADDMDPVGDAFQITCQVSDLESVKSALQARDIPLDSAQVTRIPNSTVNLDAETGKKILRLMDGLDDHDDVQNVYANFELPEELLAEST